MRHDRTVKHINSNIHNGFCSNTVGLSVYIKSRVQGYFIIRTKLHSPFPPKYCHRQFSQSVLPDINDIDARNRTFNPF